MSDLYQRHLQEAHDELKVQHAALQAEFDNYVEASVETFQAHHERLKALERAPKTPVDYLIYLGAFLVVAYVVFTLSIGVYVWVK